ncbi:hypothetical protein GJAV_G00075490 [Gymnothorax javanicus]|nr:hypothetical protein GJAV_G00075490 [Gymnothorax javanicus]
MRQADSPAHWPTRGKIHVHTTDASCAYIKKQPHLATDNQQLTLPLTPGDDWVLIHSDQPITQPPWSTVEESLKTSTMESKPKKWVMQPLSPNLDLKDLKNLLGSSAKQTDTETLEPRDFSYESITVVHSQPSVTVTSKEGDSPRDVVVQAKQVAVTHESISSDDWRPSSSSSSPSSPSSTGSHSGFYSFEDQSPEVEKTKAWMSSPEREAKLAVLKQENGYELRAYVEERRPEKLFEDTNGDSRYRVGDIEDKDEQEQNQERMEIIRSQAPKINSAFNEQWSALERLDLSYSSQRLLEGLSLSYTPVRTEEQQTEAEPGTIDTEQINFSEARRQFLMMEQSKHNPFLQSPKQILRFPEHEERPSQSEVTVDRKAQEDVASVEKVNESPKFNPDPDHLFTSEVAAVSTTEERGPKIQSTFDDIDSGLEDLSLEPSRSYTYDGNSSNEVLWVKAEVVPSPTSKGETPIEREIRIAQEREENLRRERGINRSDSKEMVQIKTTLRLSLASPTLTPIKAREKNRVSFLIQREIEQDSQREEDLHHQGKVPGLYDRGTTQELGERKRLFEQQEDLIPVTPSKKSLTGSLLDVKQVRQIVKEDRKSPEPEATAERTRSPESDLLSPCCPHRHPNGAEILISSSAHLIQHPASQRRVHNIIAHSIPADKVSIKDGEGDNTSQSSSFNYSSPSTSGILSLSPLVEPTNVAGKSRLQWQGFSDQFSLKPRRETPDAIRKEIERDLMREEELRKWRESGGASMSLDGGLDSLDTPFMAMDPTPLQHRDEDGPLKQILKEEVRAPENSVTTAHSDELIARRGLSLSLPSSTNMVDSKDSHISNPILTPDKARIESSASPSLTPSTYMAMRFPSVSVMTPQPWLGHRQGSPALARVLPLAPQSSGAEAGSMTPQRGLTETLLEDFEERRIKLKLEEGSYAGIQPTDDVNNEVLEATRVTRHKNMRALKWEAGVYANENSN